ncbi:MAG TPA: helix-turn-helix transcriptional regulator [Candidatus Dormibacteraeota bacterium]|nr:helix-turn-helix transcriptional regulator [Candidatus Dormibacteraeota bacterium]
MKKILRSPVFLPEVTTMAVRNCLQRVREEQGLSREEVAVRANVTRQTIRLIEQHRVSPTIDVAYRIAAAVHLSIGELFEFTDEPSPSLAKKLLKTAKGVGEGLLVSVAMVVAVFLAGVAVVSVQAKQAYAAGDYQEASIDDQVVGTLWDPFRTRAEYQALHAGSRMHIGIDHNARTPVPSRASCSTWLGRYGPVVDRSKVSGLLGRVLHADAADCLDRVGATQAAFQEREALIAHPGMVLARSAATDFAEEFQSAFAAEQMRDNADALQFLELAHTLHPALFARVFGPQKGKSPYELQQLQPLVKSKFANNRKQSTAGA